MADQLYLDFKIYYSLNGFFWDCICFVSAFFSKVNSPSCYMYKQVKCDI